MTAPSSLDTTSNGTCPTGALARIGLIGDVHAQDQSLEATLAHLENAGVDALLCTGDVADGPGDIERCIELLKRHRVHTVKGNHDRWLLQDKARHVPNAHRRDDVSEQARLYLENLPTQIRLDTVAGPLLLCHGVLDNDLQKVWPGTQRMPAERCAKLDALIANRDTRWMINGHVHYRTLIHFEQLTLINAGTLRGDHHPGFSLIDLTADEIIGFELEGGVHEVRRQALSAGTDTRIFANTQQFDGEWTPVTLYA